MNKCFFFGLGVKADGKKMFMHLLQTKEAILPATLQSSPTELTMKALYTI